MSDFTWIFDAVEFATLGTHGRPGERVFLFQVGAEGRIVTLHVEKLQMAALARAIATALEDLERPGELPPTTPLIEPAEPAFRVGELQLAVDIDAGLLVIEAIEDERDVEVEPRRARFTLSRELAARLAIRIAEVVEQGRPTCPLCGYPINPEGHSCPRTNGHRAPAR